MASAHLERVEKQIKDIEESADYKKLMTTPRSGIKEDQRLKSYQGQLEILKKRRQGLLFHLNKNQVVQKPEAVKPEGPKFNVPKSDPKEIFVNPRQKIMQQRAQSAQPAKEAPPRVRSTIPAQPRRIITKAASELMRVKAEEARQKPVIESVKKPAPVVKESNPVDKKPFLVKNDERYANLMPKKQEPAQEYVKKLSKLDVEDEDELFEEEFVDNHLDD